MSDQAKSPTNVALGIPDNALAHLSDDDQRIILTLLARVSEKSYRRGFQQGHEVPKRNPDRFPPSLFDWRYGADLSFAPPPELPYRKDSYRQTAANRMDTEASGALQRVGLRINS